MANPPECKTSGLAIAALVCGIAQVPFLIATGIPAIILGHAARRQIRRTGQSGSAMALTGLILGYVGTIAALMVPLIFMIMLWRTPFS